MKKKKKKKKKGHPLGFEQTHGRLYRDFPQVLCTWSFRECRRHYSSWEVSRESQSSPLRFFVESIATDHQEASSFFWEITWRRRILRKMQSSESDMSAHLQKNFNPNKHMGPSPSNDTPLIYAVRFEHKLFLNECLRFGGDPQVRN